MGSYRSKEDDVAKISTSVYITNFPESISAKELFNSCKIYGHVVDSFIPNKRAKNGKRFGFVRFINVFNVERVVKGATKNGDVDEKLQSAMVLDDECLISRDLSNFLIGRVKEFATLANLKMTMSNEGFMDVKIQYMGEFWVMLEFASEEKMKMFQANVSIGSWFSDIRAASLEFQLTKRIAWVEIEGIPFKLWSGKTFNRIANKWGELLDVDDQEETCFHSKRLCIHTKMVRSISEEFKIIHRGNIYWVRANETPGWVPDFLDEIEDEDQDDNNINDERVNEQNSNIVGDNDSEEERISETVFQVDEQEDYNKEEGEIVQDANTSEDPFKIYPLLKKIDKKDTIEIVSDGSMKYPPGFSPKENYDENSIPSGGDSKGTKDPIDRIGTYKNYKPPKNPNDGGDDSISSGHFKVSEIPRTGGSILGILDEVVKVGMVMDYKMEGCMSNIAEIIEAQGAEEVNFLALQETKMNDMHIQCVRACWGNLTFDYVHSAAVGNSGGILCVWDPNFFVKDSVTVSDSFVMIRGIWRHTSQDLLLVVVYAPQDIKEKYMLWEYLHREVDRWKGQVVIMGDFNEVRCKSDRYGSVFNARGAQRFNSFIVDSGLVEINLGGCHFTWCHKSANKMSKLDRFLVSENLLNTSPNITAISLDRYLSDHRPILLRERYVDYGPTPFKIFHYWVDIEGFNKIVEDAWKTYSGKDDNVIRYLMGKFKHVKSKIREWNVTNKAGIKKDKDQCIRDLADIDGIIDSGNGGEEEVLRRAEMINKIQKIDGIQAKELAQKIKIKWAIEGDENTKFFHGMLNKKRSSTGVRGVMVDGAWVDDPQQVKKEFYDHFSARFSKPNNKDASIQMEFPKKILDSQLRGIECEVSNDEIKKAVWDCGTEKAPGPDGFTFGFFRHFWYLIHNDVYDAVRYFFSYTEIPKGCNSSFVALIPKTLNANFVKDFRPISLIGSIYKIIAKILANHLVGVLDDIVNEVQSAFIADRQILDGPFILNEVIQWCKTKKKQVLIFKVDFEKAYDSVRWDFLDEVLRKFGFGDKWCKWIQCCLNSSRGSILVNGSPTEEFQFGKGLKQGDPLSPFLFILIMESLHLSFQRIVDAGMFKGIKLGGGLVNLSHMFYADDAVFVGQWCENNITTLVHVLDCFHKASGLRINMSKSKIMG
ncbi:RNA-directed DNA polymerase, eukaryota, partial [Tanacetum coccineum]